MMPKYIRWYDWFLHPIRSWHYNEENRVIIHKIAEAVKRALEKGAPAGLTEAEALLWLEQEIQVAVYEVIK